MKVNTKSSTPETNLVVLQGKTKVRKSTKGIKKPRRPISARLELLKANYEILKAKNEAQLTTMLKKIAVLESQAAKNPSPEQLAAVIGNKTAEEVDAEYLELLARVRLLKQAKALVNPTTAE